MAEHEGYRHRHLAKCQCPVRYRLEDYRVGESPYVISHEAEQVTYECTECGDMVGVFYRVSELERERPGVDKSLIGKVIKADRCVAWVGYAKNPSTVVISENELRERTKELCAKLVNKAIFGKRLHDGWQRHIDGPSEFTLEQAEAMLREANWRVRRGFEQWARYRLRGKAYCTNPLRDRGFWFQDVPVEGEVVATVACVTGTQSPGWGGGSWDDYEPTCLSGAVHHSLYGIVMDDGARRLVYPLDAEEVNDEGSD